MPEGDTIHRAAARLAAALDGHAVLRVETPRTPVRPPRPGTAIERVEARGKHLLIRFDGGRVLRTHMGMPGSWHLYRSGERWRRPAHQARAVIEVDGWVAVCFSAPTVEWLGGGAGADARLAHLGPDLCRPDADLDEAARRLATIPATATEIGVALLDQRVAAGIGNVYKSETLFVAGVDPFAPVSDLSPATRRRLIAIAARLLRANLDGPRRRTVPGGLAVYGRTGRPCRRCATPIRGRRQGEQARMTYWCPTCQAGRA
jgi:endonuclease-8